MVPWKLHKRFVSEEEKQILVDHEDPHGDFVFQRYCHVYKEGELEHLCSGIPDCEIEESGWDTGNWFVKLKKRKSDVNLGGVAATSPERSLTSFNNRACKRLIDKTSDVSSLS